MRRLQLRLLGTWRLGTCYRFLACLGNCCFLEGRLAGFPRESRSGELGGGSSGERLGELLRLK